MKIRSSRLLKLLEDPEVKRWYDNLAARSGWTARQYLGNLGYFCDCLQISPRDLVREGKKRCRTILLDWVQDRSTKISTEKNNHDYSAVVSWLRHNGIVIEPPVNIPQTNIGRKSEETPSRNRVKDLMERLDVHKRKDAGLMAYGGLRGESVGNFDGTDGLQIRDLRDFDLANLRFTRTPSQIKVRGEDGAGEDFGKWLSKAKHSYFTLAYGVLQQYLVESFVNRVTLGETLTGYSPVRGRGDGRPGFITSGTFYDTLNKAIHEAGYQLHAYQLRASFDMQMTNAQNNGLLAYDYSEFFMGHKGRISATYTVRKQLPPETLKEMEAGFLRATAYFDDPKSKKECPSCHCVLEDSDKFCRSCGQKLGVS